MNKNMFAVLFLFLGSAEGMRVMSGTCLKELSPEEQKKKADHFESLINKDNVLGSGHFGKVYKVQYQKNPPLYGALKIMETEVPYQTYALSEICINKLFAGSPNVNKIIDELMYQVPVGEDKVQRVKVYILLELGDKSLQNEIDKPTGRLDDQTKILNIYKGIITGINEFHKKSVVHNDIYPKNIILFGNEAKLADFGVSGLSTEGYSLYYDQNTRQFNEEKFPYTWMNAVGMPQNNDIKKAGDILYELLFKKSVRDNDNGKSLVLPTGTDSVVAQILLKSLLRSEENKVTAQELLFLAEKALSQTEFQLLSNPLSVSLFQGKLDLKDAAWKTGKKFESLQALRNGFESKEQEKQEKGSAGELKKKKSFRMLTNVKTTIDSNEEGEIEQPTLGSTVGTAQRKFSESRPNVLGLTLKVKQSGESSIAWNENIEVIALFVGLVLSIALIFVIFSSLRKKRIESKEDQSIPIQN